ncbi:uncharacterized protein LOC100370751 [Saccoglossus kowalevskii]|uniref:Uncharacterized protein LOC100370751 n=1 Tax=Saccoglossus kowalevskii TaxID=10224 RepID=A0ABM0GLF3_SACKO|nr:PREDICTED: uncharacterized protein LOC100370751 [Saccoglossus kowalevskii]
MSNTLTEEQIDEIGDLMTAFDIADDLGIEVDEDLQNVEEVKNFLRNHIKKSGNSATANLNAITLVRQCQEEDEERRKRLQTLYENVEEQLDSIDSHVASVLQREEVIGNFTEKIVRASQSLQTGDCPILVAGETSAGKSSLLNLILGEDILPFSHLSSTSTICILRWGERKKMRINYMFGRRADEIELEGESEDVLKTLSKYVHQTRDREKRSNYESIEVFMPIPVLQNGIFIVDSPGIGENEAMDNIVTSYLNEAFAFIYVINSANAGGVQEDRLQRFLRLVVEKKSPDEQMKFNARAAIFVCNKWDAVPKVESEKVKQDTMKKLQRCWLGLSDSQVFFLSTKNASMALKHGSVTNDFEKLLRGIQHLLPISLTSKVQVHYRWLDYFVSRVLHHVNTYLNKTRRSTMNLTSSYRVTEQRLLRLEKEAGGLISSMKRYMEERVKEIVGELQEMLRSQAIKVKMRSWEDTETPTGLTWPVIESHIETAVTEKLHKVLCDWDEENPVFRELQPDLLEKFKGELKMIEGKMAALETALERPDIQLDDEEFATKDFFHDEQNKYKHALIQMSAKRNASISSSSSLWLPFSFVSAIFSSIPTWVTRANIKGTYKPSGFDRQAEKMHMETYTKNPSKYMTERALYVLDKFAQTENVKKYAMTQLKPAYNVITKLENTVPKMIQADKEIMEAIKRDTRSVDVIQKLYGPIKLAFNNYHGLLSKYGYEDIREFDLEPAEFKGYGSSAVSECSSFTYHYMELRHSDATQTTSTIMKRYKAVLNEASAYQMRKEEDQFRKLRFPNIPNLIGLIQDPLCSSKKPAFVFEDCKCSLRRFQLGESKLKRPASFYKPIAVQSVVSYVSQTARGLDFLHRKGLVHIELSLDTLMVTVRGKVLLTNISLPRTISLDPGSDTNDKNFMYLSPEVLEGAQYDSMADIYSIGLLMWELWYGEKITQGFKQLVVSSRERFTSYVLSSTRPRIASDKPMHKAWRSVMEECWSKDAHLRPSALNVFHEVEKVRYEED